MIGKRTIRNARARLARVVAGKLSSALQRARVRDAARHPFADGGQHIQHAMLTRADSHYMLRVLRQAGCEDTRTPAYSIERERAIQIRADKRDPNRAIAHVRRNANGKLVKVDIAAGFCRDDGHDIPLARRWMDNAGKRAVQAILAAGQHRAAMRDAVDDGMRAIDEAIDAAITEHATVPPDTLEIMGQYGTIEAMTTYAAKKAESKHAPRGSLHNTRAQSALIRAELEEARAMASLSGKAKRRMRDQLRAAKHAAR